jgi:hypothetical protein
MSNSRTVIPAKAGTQPTRVCAAYDSTKECTLHKLRSRTLAHWVPAFAGMTAVGLSHS